MHGNSNIKFILFSFSNRQVSHAFMSAKNDRFPGNPQFSIGRRCCQLMFAKLSDLLNCDHVLVRGLL